MKYHILTLFPEMVQQGLKSSIIGRAAENGLISLNAVNIRDYTEDKHGKVDDYPYGGGAGMLMQAQPVFDAYLSVAEKDIPKKRCIYLTPQGTQFTQAVAQKLAGEEELIFICGHYEGIDERVLEEIVTDYVSIGDYILTGGELAAMVMIDAISRLVPGVLNNDMSAEKETFHNDLLEYPQYSRPEVWHGKQVPDILLSGNHRRIEEWRLEQAKDRTQRVRPDLFARYQEKQKVIKYLAVKKRYHIHMMELLNRGNGEILSADEENILLYDHKSGACMLTVADQKRGEALINLVPEGTELFVISQEFMLRPIEERFGVKNYGCCHQACYTRKETLPVGYKDIRLLDETWLDFLAENYSMSSREELLERIHAGVMYGAFNSMEKLVGFIGMHEEGSVGLLYVSEEFRRKGIGEALEAYAINRMKSLGWVPFGHIWAENEASVRLQEKLGLNVARNALWWLGK